MTRSITFLFLYLLISNVNAQNVLPQYEKYFYKYEDDISTIESALNLIDVSSRDVGYSVALIAGVWKYPQARDFNRDLNEARIDVDNLKRHFDQYEYFNEIIVLENEHVSYENLNYFLNYYIPTRVNSPKSRFLFAYSGHGVQDERDGYILTSKATQINEKLNRINLNVIKSHIDEVVKKAHHTLVLINSCYSGSFIPRTFGNNVAMIPKERGAHVITAGSAGQLTYGHGNENDGSDFFEIVLDGLNKKADSTPTYKSESGNYIRGDGIITTDELHTFLLGEFRRKGLDDKQIPQSGDIARKQSRGSFYFLRPGVKVIKGAIVGKVGSSVSFGIDEKMVDSQIHDYQNLLQNARQSFKNGDLDKALTNFDQILSINPDDEQALFAKANTLIELKRLDDSIGLYTEIIQKFPSNAKAYVGRGVSFSLDSDDMAAIQDFNKAIDINPEYAPAYENRGISYLNLNELMLALPDFEKAIELDSNSYNAHLYQGISYSNQKQYSIARVNFTQAIVADPTRSPAYIERGKMNMYLGDYEASIYDLKKAISTNQDDPVPFFYIGNTYISMNQKDEAIKAFTKAIELDSGFADAYSYRGKLYSEQGNTNLAWSDINKAIELEPNNARAYYHKGIYYHIKNRYAKAIEYYSKSLEHNQFLSEALYYRARAYNASNKIQSAIQDLTQFLSLSPDFAEAYKMRGELYRTIGKTHEATNDEIKYNKLKGIPDSRIPVR